MIYPNLIKYSIFKSLSVLILPIKKTDKCPFILYSKGNFFNLLILH